MLLPIVSTRSVTSLAKVAAAPSIGGAAQLAFDLFHYLFRDRILDLQAAFPADSRYALNYLPHRVIILVTLLQCNSCRMIDRKTGRDKGPFWGKLQ